VIGKIDPQGLKEDPAYEKLVLLKRMLAGKAVVVSFSGGVDSTFLALAAKSFCRRCVAVTADSPTLGPGELEEARRLAQEIGIEHRVVRYDELENAEFAKNPTNRCYFCKKGLLESLRHLAEQEGYDMILEGTNADDVKGHRPGYVAVRETGARSPLLECRFTKEDIRRISRKVGLPTWNKPSMACLASRIPYYEPISYERLRRVGLAETFLRKMGFAVVRVRDHGSVARIEVDPEKIPTLVKPEVCRKVVARLRQLGYKYVTADLSGYRTGSMNE